MKDVLLIANYWHFECEKASSRYRTLADMIVESGMHLEVLTSSFMHMQKMQREYDVEFLGSFKYDIKLIYEPCYKKNISLKRIYSHHCFGKNIVKYLKKRKKPDVIFCSVPSLGVGSQVSKYAKKNNIPLVIDVQDLWPEAFEMALHIPVISKVLFLPMKLQANHIYRRADVVSAVSETYMNRALRTSIRKRQGVYAYIGVDPELVENVAIMEEEKPGNEFWISYIGALGHSYDIKLIIDAIANIKQDGINNIVFKVMGTGVLEDEFKKYAKEKNVNVEFAGQVEYAAMLKRLRQSDVAVNPIVSKSVASIINKVADYAIAGKPVINTQTSMEYRKLLEQYEAGINCAPGNVLEVKDAIKKIYTNTELKEKLSRGALDLGMKEFNRRETYKKIVDVIKEI